MFSKIWTKKFTEGYLQKIEKLKAALEQADAIVIGAGAGLSASAGFTYDGERFQQYFGDFAAKYGIRNIYSGGFYPYSSWEEYWAWWSRHIYYNRYVDIPKPTYRKLLELIKDKDYFVITTNVDHCFQKAGFDKKRLFYMQGDYGLWQCSKPCHQNTYDNEEIVRRMLAEQKEMRIPEGLIPRCPKCGRPLTMNLRCDSTFVEDEGWHKAAERYREFLRGHDGGKVLYLELGVGENTPAIIKYPFWRMTAKNGNSVYVCVNMDNPFCPQEIQKQSICIDEEIGQTIDLCFLYDFLYQKHRNTDGSGKIPLMI